MFASLRGIYFGFYPFSLCDLAENKQFRERSGGGGSDGSAGTVITAVCGAVRTNCRRSVRAIVFLVDCVFWSRQSDPPGQPCGGTGWLGIIYFKGSRKGNFKQTGIRSAKSGPVRLTGRGVNSTARPLYPLFPEGRRYGAEHPDRPYCFFGEGQSKPRANCLCLNHTFRSFGKGWYVLPPGSAMPVKCCNHMFSGPVR